MSALGGKAATIAAVTGAGSCLRDRFPTRAVQLERLAQLRAQLTYYIHKKQPAAAAEVRAQIREFDELGQSRRAG